MYCEALVVDHQDGDCKGRPHAPEDVRCEKSTQGMFLVRQDMSNLGTYSCSNDGGRDRQQLQCGDGVQ